MNRKYKKIFLSIFSALCLCLSAFPAEAFAVPENTPSARELLLEKYGCDTAAQTGTVSLDIMLSAPSSCDLSAQGTPADEAVNLAEKSVKAFIEQLKEKAPGCIVTGFGSTLTSFVSIETDAESLGDILGIFGIASAQASETRLISGDTYDYFSSSFTETALSAQSSFPEVHNVTVAVIDSAFVLDHECMKISDGVSVKLSEDEMNEKISALGYGAYYNEKVPFYYNYTGNDCDMSDHSATAYYHGQHVCGIVAGNSRTLKGVLPNAQVFAMKVFSDDGYARNIDIVHAIEDAVTLGADVINLSIGEDGMTVLNQSNLFKEVFSKARQQGVVVVCAAGNSATSDNYAPYDTVFSDGVSCAPAVYDTTLAVGSGKNGSVSSFSSRGPSDTLDFYPDILGPGEEIFSSVEKGYTRYSGTSMASPHLAGVAGLIKKNLTDTYGLSPDNISDTVNAVMMNTADILTNSSGYVTVREQGNGYVNIGRAKSCGVILTEKEKKACVSLGEASESSPSYTVTLELKNLTGSAAEFTPGYIKSGGSDGYTVKFSQDSVTVPAGQSVGLTATVTADVSDSSERYIEGYFIMQSKSPDFCDVHVGFLGFYGDFAGSDDILATTEKTGLFENGIYSENPDAELGFSRTATVSPNGDGYFDTAIPCVFLFRSAETLTSEIFTADGEYTGISNTLYNVPKDSYEAFLSFNDSAYKAAYGCAKSVGSDCMYSSGGYDFTALDDGDYIMRLSATAFGNDEFSQSTDLKFTVDTVAPEITDYNWVQTSGYPSESNSVTFMTDEALRTDNNGRSYCTVTDSVTGKSTVCEAVYNQELGVYTAEFEGTWSRKEITLSDAAGNTSVTSVVYDVENIESFPKSFILYKSFSSGVSQFDAHPTGIKTPDGENLYVVDVYILFCSSVENVVLDKVINDTESTEENIKTENVEWSYDRNKRILSAKVPVKVYDIDEKATDITIYGLSFTATCSNSYTVTKYESFKYYLGYPRFELQPVSFNKTEGFIYGFIRNGVPWPISQINLDEGYVEEENIIGNDRSVFVKINLNSDVQKRSKPILISYMVGGGVTLYERVYFDKDAASQIIYEDKTEISIDASPGFTSYTVSEQSEDYNAEKKTLTVTGTASERSTTLEVNGEKITEYIYDMKENVYRFSAEVPIVGGRAVYNVSYGGYEPQTSPLTGEATESVYNPQLGNRTYTVTIAASPALTVTPGASKAEGWLSRYFDRVFISDVKDTTVSASAVISDETSGALYINSKQITTEDCCGPLENSVTVSSGTAQSLFIGAKDSAGGKTYYCLLVIPCNPVLGDTDYDGIITAADALIALQYSVGKTKADYCGAAFTEVSGDGFITAADALKILQLAVGKISSFD